MSERSEMVKFTGFSGLTVFICRSSVNAVEKIRSLDCSTSENLPTGESGWWNTVIYLDSGAWFRLRDQYEKVEETIFGKTA